MKNIYKVNKQQWNKWNKESQKLFNILYKKIKNNYKILYPNSFNELSVNAIKVVAWNTAWIAADIISNQE